MWNMTLRVCLNRSVFLLFSLSRELSPFLLHEHVPCLLVSKLFILSLHSLYKFYVSCFVFSDFNSLPPASLSLLLHFNCDFRDYLRCSRSVCIKCPSGINLLLVFKPRLFGQGYPTDIPFTVRNKKTHVYLVAGMIASIRGKKPHVYRVIILKQMADHIKLAVSSLALKVNDDIWEYASTGQRYCR